jgi:2-dehydropantoate 2-reductase
LNEPHWHVLGAGAIGCLFAAALHGGGCATTLLLRQGSNTAKTRVTVEHDDTTRELYLPVSTPGDQEPISHLLVTTKACDARTAVASVASRLEPGCQLLLMVNGMGLAASLHRDFPQAVIYCGTTTEGAFRLAPRHVQHAGRGQTRIGRPGQAQPPPWFEQWSNALDTCIWDADIEQALWLKLAINCAINPLTALHDCRNGELARRPELAQQVARLCQEIAAISGAAGFDNIAARLQQEVDAVIAATADNFSSMLQDVRRGRTTEIDHITGYLLQIASRHHIQAPHNAALLQRIHNLDR